MVPISPRHLNFYRFALTLSMLATSNVTSGIFAMDILPLTGKPASIIDIPCISDATFAKDG